MSKYTGPARGAKSRKHVTLRRLGSLGFALPAVLAAAPAAHAFQLYDGSQYGNSVEINLNITASYTGLFRVGHTSPVLASPALNSSGYMGDNNFRKGGVVGDLFSILPVLDIKDGNAGIHLSGEYYVNTVYLGHSQSNGPDGNSFLKETRDSMGHNGRMLDAFAYDSWSFGDGQQFTLKAGQQTLFWGQSLFSTDGISGGQAAVDVITAQNLVNPQSQQVFLPVGQIVATYQPNSVYTIQGYYQYQWIPYNLAGVGSYFSTSDVTGPGAQPLNLGPAGIATPTKAITPPSQDGQFGLSLQAQYGNYDAGLFVERYDAKTPTLNIYGFGIGAPHYRLIYARDIWLYGTSLSTTIGATNVAGEISLRTHNPVASGGPVDAVAPPAGSANSNPEYPVGNTVTALANFIYGSPALKYDPGGITLLGEVEYDKLLRITRNGNALTGFGTPVLQQGRSNDGLSIDVMAIPAFFEVLPNLELSFPVSLNYVVAGNSLVQSTMNHGTGGYSFGISATYRENWNAALNYVGYFGKAASNPLNAETAGSPDRAYISLNLNHTF